MPFKLQTAVNQTTYDMNKTEYKISEQSAQLTSCPLFRTHGKTTNYPTRVLLVILKWKLPLLRTPQLWLLRPAATTWVELSFPPVLHFLLRHVSSPKKTH
jgi:hypothetical protein